MDELKPLSKAGTSGGFDMGLTIVDSLDTLHLMGLEDEFEEARKFVHEKLNVLPNHNVNLFETTIRIVGGLLSAYHFVKDEIFLAKAKSFCDHVIGAFSTNTGIPHGDVNPGRQSFSDPSWARNQITTSEATTLQLEWGYLSHLTKNSKYLDAVMTAQRAVIDIQNSSPKKLLTRWVRSDSKRFGSDNMVTIGGRVDSAYEYYLKVPVMFGRDKFPDIWNTWQESVKNINSSLVMSVESDPVMKFTGKIRGNNRERKMDHLECFYPGSLALSSIQPNNPFAKEQLQQAEELTYTCWKMYESFATGLAPEIATFTKTKLVTNNNDHHNLLRPEAVEAFFYLWRVTKKQKYRDWGWKVFQAFDKYSRTQNGFCNLNNVEIAAPSCRDKMESFFLAETLKYLFLLFSDDDVLPLDEYVFNTEAHPLPIIK